MASQNTSLVVQAMMPSSVTGAMTIFQAMKAMISFMEDTETTSCKVAQMTTNSGDGPATMIWKATVATIVSMALTAMMTCMEEKEMITC